MALVSTFFQMFIVLGMYNFGYKISLNLLTYEMNGLQVNICILCIEIAWSLKKLGINLENKVPPNLNLEKIFY